MKGNNNLMDKIKKILSGVTKKQWIILGSLVLIVIILLIILFVVNNNDNKDLAQENKNIVVNDSQGIIQEATYSDLTITNIALLSDGNYSTFTATVINNSETDKNIEDFDIVLKKGDKEVIVLYAYLGDVLKKGDAREISASVGMKLSKEVVDNAEYREHK